MRALRVGALVGLLSVTASSQDQPPEPRVVSEREWVRLLATAKGRGEMLDEAVVRRLKALTPTVLIERRAKTHTMTTPAGADDVAAVAVCPVGGGEDIRTFLMPKDAVADWQQWDRLTWRQRPFVNVRDVLEYADEPSPPVPARTPNPGLEPDELDKPRADGTGLADWVDKFARAAFPKDGLLGPEKDPAAAKALWEDVSSKTWILRGTVTQVEPERSSHVRLDHPALVRAAGDRERPLFVTDVPKGLRVLRTWGFPADVYASVIDPQLGVTVQVGDRVEVTVDFERSSFEVAKRGQLNHRIRLWRIALAAPRGK
jgi:hypothetical protein